MNLRCYLLSFVCVLCSSGLDFGASPPNVVIFLADDLGFGDLGLNGNTNIRTPRIDSLGTEGARFERFYVCPVCSPTRAEMLTGRYHPRCGIRDVSRGGERLNLDEKTIADHFLKAGYATGLFGKWHNGTQFPYHPLARGFEQFYGFTEGHWGTYFNAPMDENGLMVKGKGYLPDDITDKALAFFAKESRQGDKGRPVFLFLSFNTPHSPMQVPDLFWDRFAKSPITLRGELGETEAIENTRATLAMVENLDFNIGKVMDQIEKSGQTSQTIFLFMSDNGPTTARFNGGLKGRKGSVDEGGVRSPLFIRHKGTIPAGKKIKPIAGAIDLLPTLADLAGLELEKDSSKPLDGKSLKPLINGVEKEFENRVLFSHWGGQIGLRTEKYFLDATGALFDMEADPGQKTDIGAQNEILVDGYRAQVGQWKKEMKLPLAKDTRPFLVGHPSSKTTYLPARDGVPLGGIRRSSSAPNCSYFENWKRLDDRIAWDVEVLTDGEYEVVLYQTCRTADVGSQIEFRLKDARLQSVIENPNDPPLMGAENDRVPRMGESYVKDFQPISLGKVKLATGRGTLTLRALKIKGKAVADVQMIELKKVG